MFFGFAFTFLKSSFCLNFVFDFLHFTPPYFYSYIVARTLFVRSGMFLHKHLSHYHHLIMRYYFFKFYICRWFTVWPIGKFIFLNLAVSIVQWVTYRNIFLLIYHCRSIKGWYHEKTFYKIILQLLYHTHCVMLKFFSTWF